MTAARGSLDLQMPTLSFCGRSCCATLRCTRRQSQAAPRTRGGHQQGATAGLGAGGTGIAVQAGHGLRVQAAAPLISAL